jgi:hypothetical protein
MTVGGACCRELTQCGRQGYEFGILGMRAVQAGAARRAFGSATLLPLSARTGPLALCARQGWQQLVQQQKQQLSAADRWSQLEAKLITLVNSLSLTAAGQVRCQRILQQQQVVKSAIVSHSAASLRLCVACAPECQHMHVQRCSCSYAHALSSA